MRCVRLGVSDLPVLGFLPARTGFEGVRGLNRKKVGLWAVGLILTVAVMEILALRLGSLEFPVPTHSDQRPAVADQPGQ